MRSPVTFACVLALSVCAAPSAFAQHLQLEEPTLQPTHDTPRLLNQSLNLNRLLLDSEVSIPLDQGGGAGATADPATRQAICFILGFFPGFGLGHLVAGHRDGFILFLIIDTVFLCAAIVISVFAPWPFYGLLWVAWIVEHVFQGYDAYVASGGQKLVERSVDRLIYAGRSDDDGRIAPQFNPVTRFMSYSF
ncbi:MAG: hypothetical protein JST54_13340 [Deltaproteobacteria bacterium]|nr:hypothetical protein [Deltaproteobacteria bacterium]